MVIGNHDYKLVHDEEAIEYFESIEQIATAHDTINGENIEELILNNGEHKTKIIRRTEIEDIKI